MDALSTDIGAPLRIQPGAWLARNWLLVAVGLVVGVGAAVAYLALAPKTYAATTTLRVEPVLDLSVPDSNPSFEEINMDDEAQILRSEGVAQLAAQRMADALGREQSSEGLLSKVSLRVPANTEVFHVTFSASEPERARAGAQAFAEAYIELRTEEAAAGLDELVASLEAKRQALLADLAAATGAVNAAEPGSTEQILAEAERELVTTQIAQINQQILPFTREPDPGGTILDEATVPGSPSSPQPVLVLGSGVALGLLLGLGVALARQSAQRVVRVPEDLEARLGLRALGHLTHLGGLGALQLESGVGRSEYDRLRNVVVGALRATDRVVVFASPTVRPVTGAVVANLAAALGRSGSKVAVVDLSSDGIAEALLGADNGFGFTDLFSQKLRLDALLSESTAPQVSVVRSGRIDLDPGITARLASTTVSELLMSLRGRFDFVLLAVDGSLGDGTAPQSLALTADAAVVVAEVGQTRFRDLHDTARSIEEVGTPVHGAAVTNGVRTLLPFNAVRSRRLGPDRQLEPPRPSGPDALHPASEPSDGGLVADAPVPPDDEEPVEAELIEDELVDDGSGEDSDGVVVVGRDADDATTHAVVEPEPHRAAAPERAVEDVPWVEGERASEEADPQQLRPEVEAEPEPEVQVESGPVAGAGPAVDIEGTEPAEDPPPEGPPSAPVPDTDRMDDDDPGGVHDLSGRWVLTDDGLVPVEDAGRDAGRDSA